MLASERFDGVQLGYLDGTPPSAMYGPDREARFKHYLGSIVVADELEATLDPNFVHVDGGLQFDPDGQPVATNLGSPASAPDYDPTSGKREFIDGFRAMVNGLSVADGTIVGTFIPEESYTTIDEQIQAYLREHGIVIGGSLLAVAAVDFPYRLRPGGDPIDIPPPFQHLIRPGEEHLNTPLTATNDRDLDHFTVRAIQAVYANAEGMITGRVGLTTNDDRLPAFPAMSELLAARGLIDQGPPADSSEHIAQRLVAVA
jgi:hypothetical protein